MAKKSHKKNISTKWGLLILCFLAIVVVITTYALKQNQIINSNAVYLTDSNTAYTKPKPVTSSACLGAGGRCVESSTCKNSGNLRDTKLENNGCKAPYGTCCRVCDISPGSINPKGCGCTVTSDNKNYPYEPIRCKNGLKCVVYGRELTESGYIKIGKCK